MKLTTIEKSAMKAVANGADVWRYETAMTLRGVELKAGHLIKIVKPMNAPKNGAQQQPYFGAILTTAGRAALRK